MTASDLAYFVRQQARMRGLQAAMISALVQSFENIRESIGEQAMATLVRDGQVEQLLTEVLSDALLARALIPVSQQIQTTVERAFWQTVNDLPRGGKIDGVLAVSFGHLNPDVIAAIRNLDTRVMADLQTSIRAGVRIVIETGLRNSEAAGTIARDLKDFIGLGPTQVQEVLNFRDALLGVNGRSITDYSLRNRVVDSLLKKNGTLTPAQVDRYTAAYRDARIAQNTNTIAGTAMKNSYKLGQTTTWEAARDNGVVLDGFEVMKTWVGVMDDREREEHIVMEGETVPIDQPYSNGNMEPGDDTYNCRCISRFSVERANDALAA